MFSWTERELNEEQSAAVLSPRSVYLLACPGSGKTRALIYKIALELSRLKSRRQFVVAITYTNRAANEIVERVDSLGIDTAQLWVGTIHAFCLEWILRPYSIYEPALSRGFRVIDEHEKEEVLKRLCAPYSRQRITFYDCDYYIAPDGYRLACQDLVKHPSLHQILGRFFEELSNSKKLDYELILWHSRNLVLSRPAIAKVLSQIFPMLLVDEFQDTKRIQYEIAAAILRAGSGSTRLFMVGDPDQAIYSSLGGYPISIDELRAIAAIEIDEMTLTSNYRSSERLVRYFERYRGGRGAMVASGELSGYPSLITYNRAIDCEDIVGEVARLIGYNTRVLGIPPNEICVIAPWWIHLASMTRSLSLHAPEFQFNGPGMVPFSRDIENFWYKLARIALTAPSPGMFVRRLRWANEVIDALAVVGARRDSLTNRSLLRQSNSIQSDLTDGLMYLEQYFDSLFSRLQIDFRLYPSLADQRKAFFESSVARVQRLEGEGLTGVRDRGFFEKVFQDRSGITVSTIHGVKGAEFDVVIAYGLLDGMVPHFSDPDGHLSAQRLLYVVGSRARKNLHLFSETGRSRGRRGEYEPTELLAQQTFPYDLV